MPVQYVPNMKTLHYSIITVIVVIPATLFGVFIEKVGENQQQPYTGIAINGVKDNYTVTEPVVFSIAIEGYGTGCGDTKVIITKENDSQFKSPQWSSTVQCVAFAKSNYFKFNRLSENTTITQPGNYTFIASFDDAFTYRHTEAKKKFSVMPYILTGVTMFHNDGISENDCGKFYIIPENHTSLNTAPVLLMKSNSTACARLTFTIMSNYKDCNGANCQRVSQLAPVLFIRNLHYEKNDGSFSITPGKDYTNSFNIITEPDSIDLENYPIGANFTATYVIKPLPNATGFYDQSIPRLVCEHYPLAVGYAADQINASDFSYIDPLNPPCVSSVSMLTKVEVSGMDYKEVTLRLAVLEQEK